jgi:hypothetical protein
MSGARDTLLAEIRAAYAAVNDELQHVVAGMSDEDLTRTGQFDFWPTATAADAVRANAPEHWKLHLKELRATSTERA